MDRTATARVRLRVPEMRDAEFIYLQASDPRGAYRWLFKGMVPPPVAILDYLRKDAPVIFIAERVDDRRPICLLMAYDLSLGDRRVHFALMGLRNQEPGGGSFGEAFEGLFLFLEYVFRLWSLERVYASVPGYNWPQFAEREGHEFELVGRAPNYDLYDHQWWDRYNLMIDRQRWAHIQRTWDRYMFGPAAPPDLSNQHSQLTSEES